MKRNIGWEPYKFDFQRNRDEDDIEMDFDSEEEGFMEVPTILQTPFGAYHVDDSMNPFRRFQFWMGNTTFPITEETKDILDSTPGVEVLLIVTKYRFIIACGKLFDFPNVRVDIERALCDKHQVLALLNEIVDKDTKETITNVYEDLKKHKFWAVYVFPNGAYTSIVDETKSTNFLRQQSVFQYAQHLSDGILITSEDEHD